MDTQSLKSLTQTSALALALGLTAACAGSQSAEGAKQGAGYGALGGAVGGMVSSLIFGGNPLAGAASGAAVGAASGAAVGAASGASRDKATKDRYAAEFGKYNYEGFVALANCDYEKATGLAAKGQQYKDRTYSVAGVWLETIIYADQNQYEQAAVLFPTLEKNDPDLLDRADTERELKNSVRKLRNIRVEHGLAPQCES